MYDTIINTKSVKINGEREHMDDILVYNEWAVLLNFGGVEGS